MKSSFYILCVLLLWGSTTALSQDNLPDPYDFIEADSEPDCKLQDLGKYLVYPDSAQAAGLAGKVLLRVLVNGDGTAVAYEELASPSPILTQAAWQAISQITFVPALKDGEPLPYYWYNFRPVVFEEQQDEKEHLDLRNLPEFMEDASPFAAHLDRLPSFSYANVEANLRLPRDAFDAKFDYITVIDFFIEPDGSASNFTVIEGSRPRITQAFISALQATKHVPAVYRGQEVRAKTQFRYKVIVSRMPTPTSSVRDRNYNLALPLDD